MFPDHNRNSQIPLRGAARRMLRKSKLYVRYRPHSNHWPREGFDLILINSGSALARRLVRFAIGWHDGVDAP